MPYIANDYFLHCPTCGVKFPEPLVDGFVCDCGSYTIVTAVEIVETSEDEWLHELVD